VTLRQWKQRFARTIEMAFCEWDNLYSMELAEADQQHRKLFDLINQLHEGLTENTAQVTFDSAVDELGTIASVLDELAEYTEYHFATEERFMVEYEYPARAAHEAAHKHFVGQIVRFKRDLHDGGALRSVEIIEFLRDWLQNHILTQDKELGAFLKKERVLKV
jgi:hemerythrin